jgi:hypothetical protein
MPFVRFFYATFGAGVNAPHCPITRPKRRKQPERYATLGQKLLKNIDKIIDYGKIKLWIWKKFLKTIRMT